MIKPGYNTPYHPIDQIFRKKRFNPIWLINIGISNNPNDDQQTISIKKTASTGYNQFIRATSRS